MSHFNRVGREIQSVPFLKDFVVPLLGWGFALLGTAGFAPAINTAGSTTSTQTASLTANSIGGGGGTSVTFTAPSGTAYSTVTIDLGSGFQAGYICGGATIFGLSGAASCAVSGSTTVVSLNSVLDSNAYRANGTAQLTQAQEVTTYTGAAFPTGYHDVPNVTMDDEGYTGGSVTYYPTHPIAACGQSGSITTRISNCNISWNGATQGNAGQGLWNLVTSDGSSHEVWQDARTGLLWSSLMTTNATSWCQASGNVQNSGGVNCSAGGGYQPSPARSYCAEVLTPASASDGTGAGGSWTTVYAAQKGGMGANSSPAVRWRLPTIYDYHQAEVDGIRFVMPDMGASGDAEWSASVYSGSRSIAWVFYGYNGSVDDYTRSTSGLSVRCVGR